MYTTPTPPTYLSYAQPQVILNPEGLGHNFPTAAGIPSLSAVHPPTHHIPSYEERELVSLVHHHTRVFTHCDAVLHHYLQAGSHNRNLDTVAMGGSASQLVAPARPTSQHVAPPEPHLQQPIASSSGAERTGKRTREGRRHNPIKPAKKAKKVEPRNDEEGWLGTLNRFRDKFKALYSVQDGQPPGGFVPETALAKISKYVKEDLKRSVSCSFYCAFAHHFTNLPTWQQPFKNTGAGEGTRIRNLEDYLKRVVHVILPKPAPRDRRSNEAVGILSRRKHFFSSLRSGLAN